MSVDDLLLWQAYAELEPWGEERADYRAALMAYTTWASGWALTGKKPPAHVKVEDFLIVQPETQRRKHRITDPAEMESLFRNLHVQMREAKP